MQNYNVVPTSAFDREIRSLKRRDIRSYEKTMKVIEQLQINPFINNLRTHKVLIRNYGEAWSTRVTGDIRIGWVFKDNTIILLLKVAGHDDIYH